MQTLFRLLWPLLREILSWTVLAVAAILIWRLLTLPL